MGGAGEGLLKRVGFQIKVRAGLPEGMPVREWVVVVLGRGGGRRGVAILGGSHEKHSRASTKSLVLGVCDKK